MQPHIDDLRREARYWGERRDLYRAKAFGPRPTTSARLEELERTARRAEDRLRRAEVAESQATAHDKVGD